jgi:glycosyltransferase involved in cell wall biosynthesis
MQSRALTTISSVLALANDYCQSVREITKEHGSKNRIHIEGKVSVKPLERWHATVTVFVLTPCYIDHHFKRFGLVYLEANQYDVPAVATPGTGAEDAVDTAVQASMSLTNGSQCRMRS